MGHRPHRRRARRILVTGHLGYFGTVAVPILQAAGNEEVGLDTDLYARGTLGNPATPPQCAQHREGRHGRRGDDLEGIDCDRIARELGYVPAWTARDGARQMVVRFRAEGLTGDRRGGEPAT